MALLQEWRAKAYNEKANKGDLQRLWSDYFMKEKEIYEQLLKTPDEEVRGTVKELAEKYNISLEYMVGFLDGINDSLKEPNPIDTMEKDTEIKLDIDCEKLYYNMVDCNAEWLYTLPQWDSILSAERRKELYRKQKNSGTIRREEPKIGRNDPCPCGSGKKYKKCCGR